MSYYPIQLDKMRNFRYGMKALHLIEKKLKKPISTIDLDNLTIEHAAIMMWAGLVHEDKELTPEKVMDLVDEYSTIGTALNTMMEAFLAAFKDVIPDDVMSQLTSEGAPQTGKN